MLLPTCSYDLSFPGAALIVGRDNEGTLRIDVPEDIPRARHVELKLVTTARADYGYGNRNSVVESKLYEYVLEVPIETPGLLTRGVHRYAVVIDLPHWLPPAFSGPRCGVEHDLKARLDVDWAIDPVGDFQPLVTAAPRIGKRTAVAFRSPVDFHRSIVLELTLESSVIVVGERIRGRVALRGGRETNFRSVNLTVADRLTLAFARGDQRLRNGPTEKIPFAALADGDAVPFTLTSLACLPSLASEHLRSDVVLIVSVDVPWSIDPTFVVDLDVLPRGSTVTGEAQAQAVGRDRLRHISAAIAERTGLIADSAPALAHGEVGMVRLQLRDAPRGGSLGLDAAFEFPPLGLGIRFAPAGVFARRASALLPESLRGSHVLACDTPRPIADDVLTPFFAAVLDGIDDADEILFDDRSLTIHWKMDAKPAAAFASHASFAKDRAQQIDRAIEALPFPAALEAHRPLWLKAARAEGAQLVPTEPALWGLSVSKRLVSGEEREFRAAIRTSWASEAPTTELCVELGTARLLPEQVTALEADATERALAVRTLFDAIEIAEDGARATLRRARFCEDPRELLPALERFVRWILAVRGEAIADAPYR